MTEPSAGPASDLTLRQAQDERVSLETVGATATSEREFLTVDGQRLAYRFSGAPSERPTVVLLHGWGASLDAVAPIQRSLESEFRLLAFDLPGFGYSDLPSRPWGSPEYADLLEQALDRLAPGPLQLIGHSFGGKLAIVLASRWQTRVQQLVLVDCTGVRLPRPLRQRAAVGTYKLARRLAGPGRLSDFLARRFGSTDYRQAGPLRATLVRVVNEDIRHLLSKIAAPTLLIWGERDGDTPLAVADIMEREIPDAGLVVFPGAGHFSYADDLPRFCRIVGHFLRS